MESTKNKKTPEEIQAMDEAIATLKSIRNDFEHAVTLLAALAARLDAVAKERDTLIAAAKATHLNYEGDDETMRKAMEIVYGKEAD